MECDNKQNKELRSDEKSVCARALARVLDKVRAHLKQYQPFFDTEQYLLQFFIVPTASPTFISLSRFYSFQMSVFERAYLEYNFFRCRIAIVSALLFLDTFTKHKNNYVVIFVALLLQLLESLLSFGSCSILKSMGHGVRLSMKIVFIFFLVLKRWKISIFDTVSSKTPNPYHYERTFGKYM